MYNRQRCFIIGSGYSLKSGIDRGLFDLLQNEITFGINETVRFCPTTMAMFGDWQCYYSRQEIFANHPLVIGRHTLELMHPDFHITKQEDLILLKSSHTYQTSDGLNKGLYSAKLTGAFTLSLAIELGFREIFLLGFDNCAIDGFTHWYEEIENAGTFRDLDNNTLSGVGFNFKGEYKTSIYNNKQADIDELWDPFTDIPNTEHSIINVSNESRITSFHKMFMSDLMSSLKTSPQEINQNDERKIIRKTLQPYNLFKVN